MSKKTITLCVALILALTLGLGGTLAYLTDTDADKNVMTVGRVQIVQNEQQRVEDGNEFTSELEQFENDKMVLPSTERAGTADEVTVGDNTLELADKLNNYIDKIVSATNTGNTDAWVRTLVAVPNGGDAEGWLHLDKAPGFETYWDLTEKVAEIAVDGISYDVLAFVHKEAVQPGVTTYPSLSGLYMDEHVDMDEDGYYIVVNNEEKRIANFLDADGKLNVLVLTQAVQADGFADAVTAFEKAFPYGDNEANVQGWFTGWTAEDIGSPGDKWPDNNPPTADAIIVDTAEDLVAALEAAEGGVIAYTGEDPITIEETVELTGDVELNLGSAELVIEQGAKLSVQGGADVVIKNAQLVNEGNEEIVDLGGGASLTLGKGTTVENHDAVMSNGGLFRLYGSSKLILDGAVISNNNNNGQGFLFVVGDGAEVVIEDGTVISGNIFTGGGSSDNNCLFDIGYNGKVTVNGGEISGNSFGYRPLISLESNGKFVMNGGKIVSNEYTGSKTDAAVIYMYPGTSVEINGGEISGNDTPYAIYSLRTGADVTVSSSAVVEGATRY